MFIVLAALAFFYAYLSYQSSDMMSFYISLSIGIIFITLMALNIFQVLRDKKKKKP